MEYEAYLDLKKNCHELICTSMLWKRLFSARGDNGLKNKKPGLAPGTCPWRIQGEAEEKIIYLRKTYHFGPQRICWYLERYAPYAMVCKICLILIDIIDIA